MSPTLLECVPNISEGRNPANVDDVVAAICNVPGTLLLDRTSDTDHNRSVITFAGPPDAVAEAAFAAVAKACELIDLNQHRGVHPRIGALDVLPFVPVQGLTLQDCVPIARRVGERIWNELGIPIYFYEAAAVHPDRVKLENIRRGQFEDLRYALLVDESRQPDLGGPALHPTAGAVIVGARKFLIAYNINLRTSNLEIAKAIAAQIREHNGGLAGIKALGLPLVSRGIVQVSINITDYEKTPVHVVYGEVQRLAANAGVEVEESELIGLIPRCALEAAAVGLLKLSNFTPGGVLETKIEQLYQV
jgi:glutamate formiminotransferase